MGPEFSFEKRLAQITTFMWVTFMFGTGFPLMFAISCVNFFFMYWIDKWLILRFYRNPKNYDEKFIKYILSNVKLAFVFHACVGFLMLTNEAILTSNDNFADEVDELADTGEDLLGSRIFTGNRLKSSHIVLFTVVQVFVVFALIFEGTFISIIVNHCMSRNQKNKYEEMEALTDDFYEEISLSSLLGEYERTKQESHIYLY